MNKINRVLVTGGAGYVGSALVPKLLDAGYEVTVFDLYLYGEDVLSQARGNKKLKEIKGDIRDKGLLQKELTDIDCVIHLACISNDPSYELDPELGKSINYDASLKLIDIAKEKGVKRFVYASSSSVYGVKEEDEVTEELSLEPLTSYSKYKGLCEEYLFSKTSDSFVTLAIRPATVCGYAPRLRLDLTLNILALSALSQKKIRVFGGKQTRPHIHIDDISDLYVDVLRKPANLISGKVYNAGADNSSVNELALRVKNALEDNEIAIERSEAFDNRSYRISSKKILNDLQFAPTKTLEDAILDLKHAFNTGKISNMKDPKYYNIKTMQLVNLK